MNTPQTDKRSHIVPKWLEYSKAIKKGELVVTRKTSFEINELTKKSIQNDFREFQAAPTPERACRLMGAGIVIGDKQLAHDMAVFIAKKGGMDRLSIELAHKILNVDHDTEEVSEIDVRIAKLRKWVSEYPNSAIAWMDLARVFTIKGQGQKAKRAATIALQLAPHDRYIVRCAVRLFLHTGDFDLAWHYIKRASKYRFDPWIKATEVNVALISDNNVPEIKKLIPQDLSEDQSFHYSELLESAGFLDLRSGNDRKARKQFRLAWKKPSDNVITHAEWIIRNALPGMRQSATLDFDRSPEARTWVNYFDLKLSKAIEAAVEWELEEPYSKFPFIVGSTINCNAGNPNLGAEIAKRGLIIAPHNRPLQNNLCYALLRAGRVEEASKYVNNLLGKDGGDIDLYCQATLGLYKFLNKNVAAGRQDYLDVINQFKQQKRYELLAQALLNWALAELDASTSEAKIMAVRSLEETETIKNPEVILLRKLVQGRLATLNKS